MLLLSPPPPAPPRRPHSLHVPVDAGAAFRFRLHFLSSLGLPDPHATLTLHPTLRTIPLLSLRASLAVLLTNGVSPPHAAKLLSAHPLLLARPPSAALHFLGPFFPFPGSLSLAVSRCPNLLAADVRSQLRPALRFLRSLGITRLSPSSASLLVLDVESTLLPKIRFLESLGLSQPDVREMIARCPMILSYSVERNLQPKVAFLVEEMNRGVEDLVDFPQYFAFSLASRIRPRFHAMRERGIELSLPGMLRPSDGMFRESLLDAQLHRFSGR